MALTIDVTIDKGLRLQLANQLAEVTGTNPSVDHIGGGRCVPGIGRSTAAIKLSVERFFDQTGLPYVIRGNG